LNFLRKTTTSIAKLVPQVIVISDLEEMEVRPQHVVEEQLQLIFTLRLMEEYNNLLSNTTTTSSFIKTCGKKKRCSTL
jgi:hypothetical protein